LWALHRGKSSVDLGAIVAARAAAGDDDGGGGGHLSVLEEKSRAKQRAAAAAAADDAAEPAAAALHQRKAHLLRGNYKSTLALLRVLTGGERWVELKTARFNLSFVFSLLRTRNLHDQYATPFLHCEALY
jgi:hypothetical protein